MPPSNAPLLSTMEAHTRQHPRCATRSDLCQSTSMIGAIPHGHHDRPYACHTAPLTYSVPERWFSRARPCALRGALGCWAPPLVLYPNAWPLSLTPYSSPTHSTLLTPRALHSHHSRSSRPHSRPPRSTLLPPSPSPIRQFGSPDHKFVKTQFDTWEEQKAKDDMGPHFIPTPGFVVKTFDRGTGVKVRSNTRVSLHNVIRPKCVCALASPLLAHAYTLVGGAPSSLLSFCSPR